MVFLTFPWSKWASVVFLRGLTYEKPANMNSEFHVRVIKKTKKPLWVLTRQIRNTYELLNIFIPLVFSFVFCFFFELSILVVKRNTVFHKRRPGVCFRVTSLHPAVHPFPLAVCRWAVHHVRQWHWGGGVHDVFYIVFTDVPDKSNSQTDDGQQFLVFFSRGGEKII